MGYTKWINFSKCITEAKKMMKNNSVDPNDHFVGADKMINIGHDAKRKVKDYKLTKYSGYQISINCDKKSSSLLVPTMS